jgi:capsule biosynthesis phosphatase
MVSDKAHMKRLIFDLDGTLTINSSLDYKNSTPNERVIFKLKEYKKKGYEIIISTSRNMRTHKGNLGKINATTLPLVIEWLEKYDIPYDEIYMGKPWCGTEGFYVDDKAIRPDEFLNLSHEEICKVVDIKC